MNFVRQVPPDVYNKYFSPVTVKNMQNRILPYLYACLLAFLSTHVSAQIIDDFSDGNFSDNPSWQGDVGNFVIDQGMLRLMAPAAGQSVLAVQGNIPDSAVWQFSLRLTFAPSATNVVRVYLMADQAELSTANAYFFEIGENGTADAIRFFRQDGAVKTLLATGVSAQVANDPVDINVRAVRKINGDWSLEAGVGASLTPQFTVNDNTYDGLDGRWFGWQCVYTATRISNFYLDNLSIQPDLPDIQGPSIVSVNTSNANTLTVIFDEAIDPASATQTNKYSIDNGIGAPQSVTVLPDGKTLVLTLANALATGNYTLSAGGVADLFGNLSANQQVAFSFVFFADAAPFDVLINEIMADPSPSIGLPEVEWIEIFNRTNQYIQLSELRIDDGNDPIALPDFALAPGAYLVLADEAAADALAAFTPNILEMPDVPSLNNDGDVLTLSNAAGQVIDRVAYKLSWHANSDKRDGGFSLERINPNTPCLGAINWTSAADQTPGGTPGAVNSNFSQAPDTTKPYLLSVFPLANNRLELIFSEGLDIGTANNILAYTLTPAIPVASITVSEIDRSLVIVDLLAPMEEQQPYTVQVSASVTDCSGNTMQQSGGLPVGLPEQPEEMDVVVNELMFNAPTFGSRYIELFNRSQRFIDLRSCYLANYYKGTEIQPIGLRRLFFPGEYLVFAFDPEDITTGYQGVHPDQVFEIGAPSIADDRGNVSFYWSENGVRVLLDSILYDESWHNDLLSSSDRDGVSLERLNADGLTNDPENWNSASPIQTGAPGTPTLANSQRLIAASGTDLINLPVTRVSPDNDGYEDFLAIYYQLPQAGYAATINIYDAGGVAIKRIVRQELIGTEGFLRWDGDLNNGEKAAPGIYILLVELFEPGGTTKREKKTISVVRRF